MIIKELKYLENIENANEVIAGSWRRKVKVLNQRVYANSLAISYGGNAYAIATATATNVYIQNKAEEINVGVQGINLSGTGIGKLNGPLNINL